MSGPRGAGGTTGATLPGSNNELHDSGVVDKKTRKAMAKAFKKLEGGFADYPHLLALRPREGYIFHSDYFKVDGKYAAILSYFHDEGANDDYAGFWGVNRIPGVLGDKVDVVILEQVSRRPKDWVDTNLSNSERVEKLDSREQAEGGTNKTRRVASRASRDLQIITSEILDAASYLQVHTRVLIKAPTLKELDSAIERIGQTYVDRFSTLRVAPFHGEQRKELSTLFARNDMKRGKGFGFTSVEYAGSYHLVTNGLSDPAGEYVGRMVGDVNVGAVIFDVNNWPHHVVVADGTVEPALGRAKYCDMWGSKISQSALLRNQRVVHIVLNGAKLDKLGPTLNGITARLDMTRGDINMLEMFGSPEDELSIFPTHLDKVVLMVEQAYASTDADRSIIRGSLKDTLNQFYVDQRMWHSNAKFNRDRLRIVGIPHDQVPRVQDLVTYFSRKYKSLANSTARDEKLMNAYKVLEMTFSDMLESSGDLFNTFTNPEIDSVSSAQRVIYDFSSLLKRGRGVAMAQLVNVIGFAVSNLSEGDVLVFHGADKIDPGIRSYVDDQFAQLFDRGGRVAYLYDDVAKMVSDKEFNRFDDADWTILGPMRQSVANDYMKALAQSIPPDLLTEITKRGEMRSYLRRGHINVVFSTDLALGVNPAREEQRAAAQMKAEARAAKRKVRRAHQQRRHIAKRQRKTEVDARNVSSVTRNVGTMH